MDAYYRYTTPRQCDSPTVWETVDYTMFKSPIDRIQSLTETSERQVKAILRCPSEVSGRSTATVIIVDSQLSL